MASTNFNDFTTPAIPAAWLNDVNLLVYQLAGNGVSAPLNDSDVKNNLGVTSDIATALASATALPGRLLNIQTFTANGTYTPTAGTTSIVALLIGGGGGGAGSPATAGGQATGGTGGGGGASTMVRLTSGFAGLAVTIGAGGAGGVGGAAGSGGGTTSLGAGITAPGGAAGGTSGASAGTIRSLGGGGAIAGIGGNIYNRIGSHGAWCTSTAPFGVASQGAPSIISGGGFQGLNASGSNAPANSGAGGGGSGLDASLGATNGGTGGSGIVIIWEYS